MPQYKVMIAQFPGGNSTHPDVSDWVTETVCKMRDDPRIGAGNVRLWRRSDTPVTMTRNQALVAAEHHQMDYVLMVDSDMSPDLPLPGAKPFWDSSFDFATAHDGPCVVAAPYCGPPPVEMVYAFRWATMEGDNPQPDFQVEAYSRMEAVAMTGIRRVAAQATGLMLIDMLAIRKVPHPRFYYEWKGDGLPCKHCGCRAPGPQTEKASTEDVAFSRDLHLAGVPLYVNWDAWAGHWKGKLVSKPQAVPDDAIPAVLWKRARELAPDPPPGRNGRHTKAAPRKAARK